MAALPFEPGWEIGIVKADQSFIEVGKVQCVSSTGKIIVQDAAGIEIAFLNTGSAEDADENGMPYLTPLTREWRARRRMAMIHARMRDVRWGDFADALVRDVYEILESADGFVWRDDSEEDYSASVPRLERTE